MQYPNALKLCLTRWEQKLGTFYEPSRGQPVGAGLLLKDCIFPLPDLAKPKYDTGAGLALVLTHECDIDQNNDRQFNDLALVCPIIQLDDYRAECEELEGAGSWGGMLQQIADDRVFRVMYLPPPPYDEARHHMEGGGLIYLNHIAPCRIEWIKDPSSQAICSLSAIGLRALDYKLQNHLLRPKASPLWHSR